MGFIIETPLSPHMAGQATRLIARDSRLLNMASRASRSNSKGEKPCTFFLEKARTDLSPAYSVKVRHLEQARSNLCHLGSACSSHLVRPTHLVNKRGAHEKARPTLPCRFSRSIQYVSLNPRANTTRFVPCLLSQNPSPQTSAIRSVPYRLSQNGAVCALNAQSKWTV